MAFKYKCSYWYIPTGVKKKRTRVLKPLSVLEKMHPYDINVVTANIIDKCENRADNLHSMCLADFASSYVSKKADNLPIEPETESCTVPVSSIDDVKLNTNIIV